jgi:hypothetical protein
VLKSYVAKSFSASLIVLLIRDAVNLIHITFHYFFILNLKIPYSDVIGAGLSTSQSREDEDGDEGDLVVDGDDSTTYGPAQYSEADVIVTSADGGPKEQRERQALRDALIRYQVITR